MNQFLKKKMEEKNKKSFNDYKDEEIFIEEQK